MDKVFILNFPFVSTMLVNSQDDLRDLSELAIHLFLEEVSYPDAIKLLKDQVVEVDDFKDSDDATITSIAQEIMMWAIQGFTNFVTVEQLSIMRETIVDLLEANGGDVDLKVEPVDENSISIRMR